MATSDTDGCARAVSPCVRKCTLDDDDICVGCFRHIDEICAWVPRVAARRTRPRIGYSFVIVWHGAQRDGVALRDNVDEIPLAAERARRFGFDYLSLKPVLERAPDGAEVMAPESAAGAQRHLLARIRSAVARAREIAGDALDVHISTNLRVLEQGNWRDYTVQPRRCHMQAFRQVLSPDGLWNCPAHRGVEKARIGANDAYAGDEPETRAHGSDAAGYEDHL